ncbi:sulfotransferase domain-containing protein [Beggiatoa leptomitoformis]|uniref:Sulfotransferase n=1 Tax=Beggiatoa leptomitoformis TaxID=288004 RepID=A0A2N9YBE1_9GAMM|nr:sulfotransferase domain-containing protein [Beggiatoa leptomitoformis]ALG66858.1 sulfotransferase [Beggiatoa leptomitoformis]AUI67788.1 sulfotransferase [Beggiatoa leptomitoformis]
MRILVNSLPKSGTHLLTKTIQLLGYQEYALHKSYSLTLREWLGIRIPKLLVYRQAKNATKKPADTQVHIDIGVFTPYPVNQPTLCYWLKSIPNQHYIQGHIPYHPALSPLLKSVGYKHVAIIRDPRAVLASFLPFVLSARQTDMGAHFLEDDFQPLSFTERLEFILQGGHAPQANVTILPFTQVFHSITAWQTDPNCLLVRFEDLVGEQGGGEASQQQATVERIAQHLEIPLTSEVRRNLHRIYDANSRTFRIGKIDSWRETIPAENLQRVIEYCEPLCKTIGYVT